MVKEVLNNYSWEIPEETFTSVLQFFPLVLSDWFCPITETNITIFKTSLPG